MQIYDRIWIRSSLRSMWPWKGWIPWLMRRLRSESDSWRPPLIPYTLTSHVPSTNLFQYHSPFFIENRQDIATQTKIREASCQMMLETIAQESENVEKLITEETNTRTDRMKTLTYDLNHEYRSQERFVKGFYDGTLNEFFFTFNNIEDEMGNRFDHQNEIVDNLSNMVTTIQKTFEVMGTDVWFQLGEKGCPGICNSV